MKTRQTQCAAILAHLQKGKTLTQAEAGNRFDCTRLAARIGELRSDGHKIDSTKIKVKSGEYVARYSSVKEVSV